VLVNIQELLVFWTRPDCSLFYSECGHKMHNNY